jgi:mgtE-like transporter
MLSSLLGTIGGIGLSSLREKIENRPSVLMLYPALIDALGDIGSILGSMETTKLALGFVSSFRTTLKEALADLSSVEMAAAIMHVFFGLAAFLLGRATGLTPNTFVLIALALGTNLMSFPLISLLSLGTATQTFKRGYDPDNFVIPLVTSASDFLATLALMIVLTVIG